jgi:hypothetical protein
VTLTEEDCALLKRQRLAHVPMVVVVIAVAVQVVSWPGWEHALFLFPSVGVFFSAWVCCALDKTLPKAACICFARALAGFFIFLGLFFVPFF